jgi:hypothetical protein
VGDLGDPREEIVDDGEVGVAVVADLGRALLADASHRGLNGRDLLGNDLHDHPPPIRRVGDTPNVAGLLQTIDDAGDRARGEAHDLGQATGRGRARVDQELERLDV